MSLSYHMDLELKSEKGRRKEFTPAYYKLAEREDLLRTRILLQLDPEIAELSELRSAVEKLLREADDVAAAGVWIKRRDRLVEIAQRAFSVKRAQAIAT